MMIIMIIFCVLMYVSIGTLYYVLMENEGICSLIVFWLFWPFLFILGAVSASACIIKDSLGSTK